MKPLKDKIILVHYINVGNIDECDIEEFITKISKGLKPESDDDALFYFIPVRLGDSRVECINPKVVSDEFYEEVLGVLENAHDAYNELLDGLTKIEQR